MYIIPARAASRSARRPPVRGAPYIYIYIYIYIFIYIYIYVYVYVYIYISIYLYGVNPM